jgi:hypothetical protein
MGSAKERLKIFENILARTNGGKDTLIEFAKAMSALNGLQTMQDMQPPVQTAQNLPPEQSNTPPQGTISPEMGESTNQGINAPQSVQNTPSESI